MSAEPIGESAPLSLSIQAILLRREDVGASSVLDDADSFLIIFDAIHVHYARWSIRSKTSWHKRVAYELSC